MLKRLWRDEGGAIISAELVLVMTILVIGMIVGLTVLRDAVVTELADVAAAIGSLNQSYTFAGVSGGLAAASDYTAGSSWLDYVDAEDSSDGASSMGISVTEPATSESAG